jgi:hypothetical protein
MALIDHTFFIGELNLPNTGNTEMQLRLNRFITKYEDRFLTELLGYDLYKQLKTGLIAITPDSKWTDIRDGADFTFNGLSYNWQGLVNDDTKTSIIANYVYYWWMRNEATQTTAVGEVITKTENSTRISPATKMRSAWDEMVNGVWQLVRFLDANRSIYTGWRGAYTYTNNYRYSSFPTQTMSDIFYPLPFL